MDVDNSKFVANATLKLNSLKKSIALTGPRTWSTNQKW
ncbi:Uncharacterised protein [uncultured archaeon]|nr:Uncharacterised protein [uncultured archaeon]